MTRIEAALASTAVRAHRRPAVTLLLTGLLVVAAARGAAELRLDNDLAALLPGSFESVQGFEKLKQKFGGVGYIAVAGYDADRAGLERFAEELAPRLEALPNIRFVESRRESPFFEER